MGSPQASSNTNPNGPKKPTPFMNFSTSIRSQVVSDNPSMTFVEVSKEIDARWRNLSDDEKAKYGESNYDRPLD